MVYPRLAARRTRSFINVNISANSTKPLASWLPGVLVASIFQFDLGGLANPATSFANREASETLANLWVSTVEP